MTTITKRLIQSARRLPVKVLLLLPESVALAVNPRAAYSKAGIPAPVAAPNAPVRLYVAPANSAGQGYRWARAAESLTGVGAINMAIERTQNFAFDADEHIPFAVYAMSKSWQRRQRSFVKKFTHVLVEAQLPLYSRGPLTAEVRQLRRGGIHVAILCHGSDIRLPSRHARGNSWSPFTDPNHEATAQLERIATQNKSLLARLAILVFVSTPDLLEDVPAATWLPVVVDPELWHSHEPVLARDVPRVVHVPSNPWIKGSDKIESVLTEMAQRGLIEYERIQGVPAAQMPAVYARADIVLDQFRLVSYGVSACEAMASGRLVIGQVSDQVRDHVHATAGLELPIVEATIDSLGSVLDQVLADRSRFGAVAATGPGFVAQLHDGAASARVLAPFLGVE